MVNTLTKAIEITKEEHNFAVRVYNAFIYENSGDYRYIYLRTDVFLLGDIL